MLQCSKALETSSVVMLEEKMTSFETYGAALAQSGDGMQIISRIIAATLRRVFRQTPENKGFSGATFLELEPDLVKEGYPAQR